MLNLLRRLLSYLLPILRSAAVRAAADELTNLAYGPVRDHRGRYNQYGSTPYDRNHPRKPRTYGTQDHSDKGFRPRPEFRDNDTQFCVVFNLHGPNKEATRQWLRDNLPDLGTGGEMDEITLKSWHIVDSQED